MSSKRKKWTEEEIQFLKDNYSTFSSKDLADELSRTVDAIEIKASKLNIYKPIKWDTDIYKEHVNDLTDGEYEVLGEYVKLNSPILTKHNLCGHKWRVAPSNFINNKTRCPKCFGNIKLTHQEFINKLNKINSNIEVLTTYVNYSTKVECKCKIDGYEWMSAPRDLLSGKGCSKCANRYKRTHNDYVNEIYEINPNIKINSIFKGIKYKIDAECLIDGYKWTTKAELLLKGAGCPRCGGVERYTTETFKRMIVEINPLIEIIGEYKNHYTKIEVKCLLDNNRWFASPHTLLDGIGCPVCNASKGEKSLASFFKKYNVKYQSQFSFDDLIGIYGGKLRFDFAIFDNMNNLFCLVEVDGDGHRIPIRFNNISQEEAKQKLKIIKYHDELKNQYCKNNNLKLIRLIYDSKNKKELVEIIKQKLADNFLI